MKRFILIVVTVFISSIVWSQKTDHNNTKQPYKAIKEVVESKYFVLETDFLQDKYGNRVMVSTSINFIKINSSEAVIQIGFNSGLGRNGVGGITAEGNISHWELDENEKKETLHLNCTVLNNIGTYDLHFMITESGKATARVTGLKSGSLTFDGKIVPLNESAVYQGSSL